MWRSIFKSAYNFIACEGNSFLSAIYLIPENKKVQILIHLVKKLRIRSFLLRRVGFHFYVSRFAFFYFVLQVNLLM